MRKYLLLSLITLITTMPDAWAKWRAGTNEECYVKDRDQFYYCGEQSAKSCSGISQNSGDDGYQYWYGEKRALKDDAIYVCCGDTGTTDGGRWKLKSEIDEKIPTEPEVGKVAVGGGTCSYPITYDACGIKNESAKDTCTEPDSCNDGLFLRNGTCVPPCPSGQGFESTGSNTCVDCPTTVHGGVHPNKITNGKQDPISGVCIKCHETAQLFSYKTGDCKDKAKIETQYTNAAFALCWQCESNTDFRNCAGALNGQSFDRTKLSTAPSSCQGK